MGSAKDNFKKGAVEMLLLTMLCEEDMYGYQMAQLVKKRSKGEITIPEGSMYPTLYRLMSKGYITDHQSTSGRASCAFIITLSRRGASIWNKSEKTILMSTAASRW